MVAAEPLEEQLVVWLHAFQPDHELQQRILEALHNQAGQPTHDESGEERRQYLTQLERLRDLHPMGDLTKSQYVMRRQMIEEELQRTNPPTDPSIDRAQQVLQDFARFWSAEPQPAERRKLMAELFQSVWQKDGQIVAVKPQPPLAPYFAAIRDAQEGRLKDPKDDADSGVTKAGATGLEPRQNQKPRDPRIRRRFAISLNQRGFIRRAQSIWLAIGETLRCLRGGRPVCF